MFIPGHSAPRPPLFSRQSFFGSAQYFHLLWDDLGELEAARSSIELEKLDLVNVSPL